MKKTALVFLVALIALSCSTLKITSSQWVSDDFNNQNLNRLLIFANTEDGVLQKEFENSTAAVLSKKGISPAFNLGVISFIISEIFVSPDI